MPAATSAPRIRLRSPRPAWAAERLTHGERRCRLERHRQYLQKDFSVRVIPLELSAAVPLGEYVEAREREGIKQDTLDFLIAAIALH